MLTPLPLPLAAGGSVALAILGIGFLIFVHELGHYLACRVTKTRVETFSIGFGTRLFGWERRPGERRRFTLGRRRLPADEHAMDFRISLFPLGGYVKMAGENPTEARTGAPDEFPGKPFGSRVLIVCAGVLMNVLVAWGLYVVAFAAHIEQEPAMVGRPAPGGPAWAAGLQAGDRILAIEGTRTRSFLEVRMESALLPADEPATLRVERGGRTQEVEVVPRYDEESGFVLLRVEMPKTLVLEDAGGRFAVGPTDRVTVAGMDARGGIEAYEVLDAVLASGATEVEIRREDGEARRFAWRPAASPPDGLCPVRVGIEPYGQPVVTAVRGAAVGRLEPGDRLAAARRGETRLPLDGASAVRRLPFEAPIDRLEVVRGAGTVEVEIPGADRAAVHAFLADVALEGPRGLAVRPIEAGAIVTGEGGRLLRYPASPAAAAGIQPGNVVVRVGGQDVSSWAQIVARVGAAREGEPLALGVVTGEADGGERLVPVIPVALEPLEGPTVAFEDYQEPYRTEGILDAAGIAVGRTATEVRNVFRMIGAFFTGRLSFEKNIGGPATIVVASSRAAQADWLQFLLFLAYISVTLAVLNILPIPILDGGLLLFLLIEKVRGSPLKAETIGRLQFVGLLLLLVLMFFAVMNDVKLLG